MRILTALLLLLASVWANPFEITFRSEREPSLVAKALQKALRDEGLNTKLTPVSEKPYLYLLNFCAYAPRVPELPEILLLLPCRIYITEANGATLLGTFNHETLLKVFEKDLTRESSEKIRKFGEKVRNIIEGAL
jgi:hypothetical protein